MTIRHLLVAFVAATAGVLSAFAIASCADDDEVTAEADEEVQVRVTDTALDPERVEVSAGTIRFRIDNDGDQTHELAVETPNGVEESGSIEPGSSGSLTVELDEGEYPMYDPLENYRERGVEGEVVVSGDTDTVERTVTDEDTDTVTREDTDTVTREDTDTVTREDTDTVTREDTVTEERTVTRTQPPPRERTTTTAP